MFQNVITFRYEIADANTRLLSSINRYGWLAGKHNEMFEEIRTILIINGILNYVDVPDQVDLSSPTIAYSEARFRPSSNSGNISPADPLRFKSPISLVESGFGSITITLH